MNLCRDSRILVVAAHPDDEVLGCGGTLAKAASLGATTSVLFLGEGVSARFPIGKYDSPEFSAQTKVRNEGSKKALKVLGIKEVVFGERHCCQFDTVPLLELTKEIEHKISEFNPTLILTHSPCEVNMDHRLVYEAVEVACRPTSRVSPSEIYSFEIVCSGNWKFNESFIPNVFINIEDFWDIKMAAWHAYEGESRAFPFPRSDEGLRALAQFRGMSSGYKLAEAFRLLRCRVN